LVDDDHGHLWLTTNAGVWRVPKAGLDRCADGPCPPLDAETFGKDEGMTSPDCLARFHPNVVKDEAGRVYVAQHNGVSVFPPEPPQRPVLRPLIELVAVNGKPVEIAPAIRLGRGQYDLLVRYNAPSFLRSSRRRLAHRLRGIDGAWIAAGPDATARYRDLPPGDYVLEIRAEDNSPDVAALAIAVAAPFWRTVPFFALLVALGAAVMVGVQRLRLHRLERQHRAITEERLRIARDLHDGLAQKFSAIGMLIDRARLDPRSQAVDELPRAREVLRETQSELGRAIWDMREGTEGQPRLEALLERVISQLLPPPETKIRLQTAEVSVPVSGLAAHEIPLVVKEAVTNAIRHARSKTIEVGVLSEEVGVHVWVRDDGRGMSGAGAGEGTGYGIIGMHERARRLGGTLNVRSAPGEGTQVSLYVPRASDGKPSS